MKFSLLYLKSISDGFNLIIFWKLNGCSLQRFFPVTSKLKAIFGTANRIEPRDPDLIEKRLGLISDSRFVSPLVWGKERRLTKRLEIEPRFLQTVYTQQIWPNTRSSLGTSLIKARLVGPLTVLPEISLPSSMI